MPASLAESLPPVLLLSLIVSFVAATSDAASPCSCVCTAEILLHCGDVGEGDDGRTEDDFGGGGGNDDGSKCNDCNGDDGGSTEEDSGDEDVNRDCKESCSDSVSSGLGVDILMLPPCGRDRPPALAWNTCALSNCSEDTADATPIPTPKLPDALAPREEKAVRVRERFIGTDASPGKTAHLVSNSGRDEES